MRGRDGGEAEKQGGGDEEEKARTKEGAARDFR